MCSLRRGTGTGTGTGRASVRTLDFQARRKLVLIATVSILGVLGIALGLIPLVQSLQPNARAIAALPRVSMPDLAPGDYARVKTSMRFNQMDIEVLFIRRHNGQLDTWTLYTKGGLVVLPEYPFWGLGSDLCRDFGPDSQMQTIECKDESLSEARKRYLRWSLDGEVISEAHWLPRMLKAKGTIREGDFVLNHPGDAERQ